MKEKANDVSLDKLKNIAKMDTDMRFFLFAASKYILQLYSA